MMFEGIRIGSDRMKAIGNNFNGAEQVEFLGGLIMIKEDSTEILENDSGMSQMFGFEDPYTLVAWKE